MEQITSAQNPKIKKLLELQEKSKARRQSGLFVVEGRREIEHCLEAGYELHSVFVCEEIAGEGIDGLLGAVISAGAARGAAGASDERSAATEGTCNVFAVSRAIYDKIAYRGGTEGVIAEVKARSHSFEDLVITKENPVIMVLESVEKPGNLGAVLRSADAAAADAVVICDPLTDLYNPNLIRASIGAVFTVPVVVCTSQQAIEWFQAGGYSILTAQLQDSSLYYDTDMTGPTAIVMGTESTGLSDDWRRAATAHIRIPMLGRLDSLNVSVSAAILMYEAVRQRN